MEVKEHTEKELQELIHKRSISVEDPAGRPVRTVMDQDVLAIAAEYGTSVHDVYREMLKKEIYPYRYIRNRDAISTEEQLKLAVSRVAVIGAGGLGGNVILLLARIGIGSLVVVDKDVFDETNLNRQALCNMGTLGSPKAGEAVSAIAAINRGVDVFPCQTKLDGSNARDILVGSDVIVDALDNVPDRLLLQEVARDLGIPLVHGTLAGFEGWIMTIFPGDMGLKNIYGAEGAGCVDQESPQAVLGVPGITPSLIAALQVMEVLKILLVRGDVFRDRILHVDLEHGCVNEFSFGSPDSL